MLPLTPDRAAIPELHKFAVCQGAKAYTASDLWASASSFGERFEPSGEGASIAIHVPDGALTLAAILWARRAGMEAVLLPGDLTGDQARVMAEGASCSHLLGASGEPAEKLSFRLQTLANEGPADAPERRAEEAGLVLLTSGTSGKPKQVRHTWSSLAASVACRPEFQDARWMSLYPLTRFAGLNTMLHASFNGAPLIVPSALSPPRILEDVERWSPTHISGTPTMWRNLLMSLPKRLHGAPNIRQISLGGEIVDQPLLNALRSAFPAARVTHIYASTELGVALSVSDGQAGFPVEWLEQEGRPVALRMVDGELWVRRRGPSSSALAAGSRDGWWPTGDLVELRGSRVHFLGRQTDLINVGGAKVAPGDIEATLSAVPGVSAARVSGRPSSLSGTLLVAEIVPRSNVSTETLRRQLFAHCRAALPAYAVPRIISFVQSVPVAASGKTAR